MTHPLEKWLLNANETKTEFANRAGVSRMAIWRVIQGQEISLAMLQVISRATNHDVPIADLLPSEGTERRMNGAA